jgi:DNA-binding NtrC family response regulator
MSNIKNPCIYVVEDDNALNKMLVSYLKSRNLKEVHGFISGEDAVKSLSENQPDIVIQDYDLPGMNGIDTMKKVKEQYPDAIFIFLSGQSSVKVAIDALNDGAYDYIIKDNFAKENAVKKIKQLLYIKKLEHDKKMFKISFIAFLILFMSSWTIITTLIFLNVI